MNFISLPEKDFFIIRHRLKSAKVRLSLSTHSKTQNHQMPKTVISLSKQCAYANAWLILKVSAQMCLVWAWFVWLFISVWVRHMQIIHLNSRDETPAASKQCFGRCLLGWRQLYARDKRTGRLLPRGGRERNFSLSVRQRQSFSLILCQTPAG